MTMPFHCYTRVHAVTLLAVAAVTVTATSCGEEHDSYRHAGPYSIRISTKSPEDAERPPVLFPHREHVSALGAHSCNSCHDEISEGTWLPKVKGTAEIQNLEQAKDKYHELCISCHESRKEQGKKAGPDKACGTCHSGLPTNVGEGSPDWIAPSFDLSLHQRHVGELGKDSCALCHHVEDKENSGIKYVEKQEAACSACHKDETKGERLGAGDAAHGLCVKCHEARSSQGGSAGPTKCEGCHSSEALGKIRVMHNPPRLEAGQKDRVLITQEGASLPAVMFDHKAHEARASFCNRCHRETEKSCRSCHPLSGGEKGGMLTPEYIFHDAGSNRSCIGCHLAEAESDSKCAGCHTLLGKSERSEHTCGYCHSSDVQGKSLQAQASSTESRGFELPDQVELGLLSNEFEPAVFPHKRVLAVLEKSVHSTKGTAAFHGKEGLYCTACHHNTPLGGKPPKCSSCHQREADSVSDKPGLMAAYHRQCLDCHRAMNLTTKCEDCHKPKNRANR